MLERDERSLTRILAGFEAIEADQRETDAAGLDVVELAAARQPAAEKGAA